MKIVHNKTQDAYTRIDNALQFYIGTAQRGMFNNYAIIVQFPEKSTAPLAFLHDKDEARKCLEKIVDYWIEGDKPILTIENVEKESILQIPESLIKN